MNFKDPQVIINRFNEAVYELSMAVKASKLHDSALELRHKRNAGSAIYQVLEWSCKHHLDFLPLGVKNNYIGYGKDITKFIEGMIEHGTPKLNDPSLSIDINLLKDKKNIIRNKHEHEGEAPNLNAQIQVIEEVRKIVLSYIGPSVSLKKIVDFERMSDLPTWDAFYSACEKFDWEERNYVLVIGPSQNIAASHLKTIGGLPWNFVFDFDPSSKKNGGFYHSAYHSKIPAPHLLTTMEADTQVFSMHSQTHYHFFANGLDGRPSTLVNDYARWNQQFEKKIEKIIEKFAGTYNIPTTVVIIWDGRQYISKVCEKIYNSLSDKAQFVFTMNPNDTLSQTIKDCPNSVYVPITFSQISAGISEFGKVFGISPEAKSSFILPHIDSVSGELTPEECFNLEEDFEVLHNKILDKVPNENRKDFLMGNPIGWHGLKRRFDIDRRKTAGIRDAIKSKLGSGGFYVYHLCHEPGVGGTTIGRRIAFDLKDDFPVLVLRQYKGDLSADKVRQVYDKTKKCVLVVMEGHVIGLDNIKPFYDAVARQNRPVVFLVIRRDRNYNTDLPYLSHLSDTECADFISEYKPLVAEHVNKTVAEKKAKELDQIYDSSEPHEKNPFYIGLISFEEDFFALNDYIKKFLGGLKNEEQKKIVAYLSIVYDYLSRPLPASFFTRVVNRGTLPESHVLNLEEYLPKEFESILLFEKSEGTRVKMWRPRHQLFAREIKEQILSGNDGQKTFWSQNIAEWCVRFIEDSTPVSGQQADYTFEILQDLFIGDRQIRGGKQFTPLIDSIRGKDGKEKVFKKLVECYPDEPHFWAHLARYYSFIDHNMEEALSNVEKAIQLSEVTGAPDPLLFHIKGMCLREAAYIKMDQLQETHRNDITSDEKIQDIQNLVDEAGQLFAKVRNQKNDEYGYVAHIQMLIRVIDFGKAVSGKSDADFFGSFINGWYGICLDLAQELLENVRRISLDNEAQERVINCENGLFELFGQFEAILQAWENVLGTSKNKPRIRRQIVRAYQKRDSQYYKDNKIVRRILEYMEENILDEPSNEKNIFLWFQTARYAQYVSLNDALDKLSKWKVNSTSLDALFYFYILNVLKTFEGYSDAREDAKKLISECSRKAVSMPNRSFCFEWLGSGPGISGLISSKNINERDDLNEKLRLVRGTISQYTHAGDGKIDVEGLQVFFRPSQANEGTGGFSSDDVNKEVEFYLGFSYDGLIADSYSVKLVGTKRSAYKKFNERDLQPRRINKQEESIEKKGEVESTTVMKLPPLKILGKIDVKGKSRLSQSYSKEDIGKKVLGEVTKLQHSYGYVSDKQKSPLFFHKNETRNFKSLKIGDSVEFTIGKNENGICAVQVALKIEN